MMNEPIRQHMTTNVITLKPDSTLGEARDILLKKRIHHIPIVENKMLVGMVTSWDLFKLGKAADDYQSMKVSEIMTTKIATLEPDQHLGAVADVLTRHLFHAVPIVNDKRELLGIVTSTDIIRYEHSKEYPENLDKFVHENMV
ncbi:MAG: CBS domain-containing protein [Saprospiraceae bacterium]|nr:CBS domain-containing protein [Saprospiraceae bacterium]MCW5921980.1 CBS domain-containing protein [Saprospiraceae bacterium]